MLDSPQAVGIQTSSGPQLWLIPLPAFTAFSASPFPSPFPYLSVKFTLCTGSLSPIPLSDLWHKYTLTHKHMSATQKSDLAPTGFSFILSTWREYKGTKWSCACHVRAVLLAVGRGEKKTIISFWHDDLDVCTLHFNSNHKTKVVMRNCSETMRIL